MLWGLGGGGVEPVMQGTKGRGKCRADVDADGEADEERQEERDGDEESGQQAERHGARQAAGRYAADQERDERVMQTAATVFATGASADEKSKRHEAEGYLKQGALLVDDHRREASDQRQAQADEADDRKLVAGAQHPRGDPHQVDPKQRR